MEAGTGRGTHHFAIHHLAGQPVVSGRASMVGDVDADTLLRVDLRAAESKAELEGRTRKGRSSRHAQSWA